MIVQKEREMREFTALLKEAGLKATFQRMSILEEIERYGHLSVDEIYEKVVMGYPSLSLATVYKNIILMVEKGVLAEVPIIGRKSKYEIVKEDHIHLVCTECGEVIDHDCTQMAEQMYQQLSQESAFALNRRQVNLYGVCSHCQQKQSA